MHNLQNKLHLLLFSILSMLSRFSRVGSPKLFWAATQSQVFFRRNFFDDTDDDKKIKSGIEEWFGKPQANTLLNIVPKGQSVIVERLGQFHSKHLGGWFLAIPFVDRLRYVFDLREVCIEIDSQRAVTKDNVSVDISGVVYVQVNDPIQAAYNVNDLLFALTQHAQSAMRTAVGGTELDDLFRDRNAINSLVRESLSNACKEWGCVVFRYEITEVKPDQRILESMDKQAMAERQRRETIKNAEAQRQAMILTSEAQRQEHINQSEGYKIRLVNESEGNRIKVENEAQATAYQTRVLAEATAESIRVVSEQLNKPGGMDAMKAELATKYIDSLQTMMTTSEGSHNTIFVPHDVTDISGMVARGLGVMSGVALNAPIIKK